MKTFISVLSSVLLFVLIISKTNSQDFRCLEFTYDKGYGLTVDNNGNIYSSVDQGNNWGLVTNAGGHINKLSIDENDNIFAAGDMGIVYFSSDMGNSWSQFNTLIYTNLNGISTPSSSLIVAVGDDKNIVRSVDQGLTWEIYNDNGPVSLDNTLKSVSMFNNQFGIIVGADNRIYRTSNGGDNWIQCNVTQANIVINYFTFAMMVSQKEGFITTTRGNIFKTKNGGENWTELNSGVSTRLNRIRAISGGTVYAAGDNGVVIVSTDNGSSWTISNTGTTENITCLYEINSTTVIAGGDNNTLIKTTDGGLTWFNALVSNSPIANNTGNQTVKATTKNLTVNAYPNPFNPSTTISYELPFTAKVNINVYDITGRLVSQLIDAYQDMGAHNVNFNAGSLSSGVYFVNITSVSGSQKFNNTLRMLLTK